MNEPRWLVPLLAALLGTGLVAAITILLIYSTGGPGSASTTTAAPESSKELNGADPEPVIEIVPEPVPVKPGLGWSAYRVFMTWGGDQGWEFVDEMEEHGISGRRLAGHPVEYHVLGQDPDIHKFIVFLKWHDVEPEEDNTEIVILMAEMVALVSGADRDNIIRWMGECALDFSEKRREKTYTIPCNIGTLALQFTPSSRGTEIALSITANGW